MSSAWGYAALAGAAILLIREARGVVEDIVPEVIDPALDAARRSGAAAGQSTAGQTINQILWGWRNKINVGLDQAGRTRTAARIESTRVGSVGYGTVGGSIGEQTGVWSATPEMRLAGRCQVLLATKHASNTTRYFTGGYCRRAADLGLL